jgi:hypothetical protein
MTARQRRHAATMRARRGVRPWDHVKDLDARDMILSMRKLFDLGCSDTQIAKAVKINPNTVSMLRTVRRRRRIL